MADPYIGQITMFGGNFAPSGWALCDGQLLTINTNQSLFSILGTTYGGDGRTTFGLPDLRGRAPMHAGSGAGLTPRQLGTKSGTENNTLGINQIPSHAHNTPADPVLNASATPPNTSDPAGAALALAPVYNDSESPATPMHANSVDHSATDPAGGGTSHNNMQPYQVINFIIALVGTFPSPN